MQATAIGEASVVDTLDEVSRLHAVRADAEAGLFELAATFADQHCGDGLPVSRRVLPGMERSVQVGGVGTPRIAEFAYAELGARMQISPWSAKRFVADALDVRHRLPRIWARVIARQARVGNARLVAARTRHLSMPAAAVVDAAMVDFVDGSMPWGRFEARLDGKVVTADPETAAEREQARVVEQFAKRTRSSEQGTAGFYVRSTVGVIARIEATVAFLADALAAFGDGDVEDLRRVKAMALLANPVQAVELLAASAALRSRTGLDTLDHPEEPLDQPEEPLDHLDPGLDRLDHPEELLDHPDSGLDRLDHPDGPEGPVDALARVDAFARRVGFTPTRLPDWLTTRPPDETTGETEKPRPGFVFDWSTLLPSLTMYLHLSAEDLAAGTGGVARWEGEGPVTHQFVHDHLRPLHAYDLRPVIDLAHQAPADAYEIPDRLRQAVHLRTPADTFPYSSATTRTVDLDHTREYTPAPATGRGEPECSTRAGNLGPLGRFHHRIKTHGNWTLRQPFDGIYLWRDPHGQIYLVDHTGTHQLTHYDPHVDISPTTTAVHLDLPGSG